MVRVVLFGVIALVLSNCTPSDAALPTGARAPDLTTRARPAGKPFPFHPADAPGGARSAPIWTPSNPSEKLHTYFASLRR